MTRQEAKELLPVIQAWADGENIQVRSIADPDVWIDLPMHDEPRGVLFNGDSRSYRIKPEPKLRPWRPEEVPVGALVRTKHGQEFIIMSRDGGWKGGVFINVHNKVTGGWQSFDIASMHEYSTDCGTTWHPCGVTE
jgi:hypothetical protein